MADDQYYTDIRTSYEIQFLGAGSTIEYYNIYIYIYIFNTVRWSHLEHLRCLCLSSILDNIFFAVMPVSPNGDGMNTWFTVLMNDLGDPKGRWPWAERQWTTTLGHIICNCHMADGLYFLLSETTLLQQMYVNFLDMESMLTLHFICHDLNTYVRRANIRIGWKNNSNSQP